MDVVSEEEPQLSAGSLLNGLLRPQAEERLDAVDVGQEPQPGRRRPDFKPDAALSGMTARRKQNGQRNARGTLHAGKIDDAVPGINGRQDGLLHRAGILQSDRFDTDPHFPLPEEAEPIDRASSSDFSESSLTSPSTPSLESTDANWER